MHAAALQLHTMIAVKASDHERTMSGSSRGITWKTDQKLKLNNQTHFTSGYGMEPFLFLLDDRLIALQQQRRMLSCAVFLLLYLQQHYTDFDLVLFDC